MSRVLSREESIERLPEVLEISRQQIDEHLQMTLEQISPWSSQRTYFLRALENAEGKIESYLTVLATYRRQFDELVAGARQEPQLEAFRPESSLVDEPTLYIAEVVVKKSSDLVRLTHGVLSDLRAYSRVFGGVSFSHYFAIAQNGLSSRMLCKSGFKVVGCYDGADVLAAQRKDLSIVGQLIV